jgi:conjugal transfer pilus assembly protein TraB
MSRNVIADPKKTKATQKLVMIVGAIVLMGAAVASYFSNPNVKLQNAAMNIGEKVDKQYDTPSKSLDPKEAWATKYEAELMKLQKKVELLTNETEQQNNQLKSLQMSGVKVTEVQVPAERSAPQGEHISLLPLPPPGREDPKSRFTPSNFSSAQLPPPTELPGQGALMTTESPKGPLERFQSPLLDDEPEVESVVFNKDRKGDKGRAHIRDTIPANTFVRSVMLSGLDAPTGGLANENPMPVLIEFVDNGNLPNGFRHRAKQCRVTGDGVGNLSDERAYIRLTRMSCVLQTGEIVSVQVKGYVAGPDARNGIRGTVQEKQGAMIARALLAGVFGGLGTSLSQSFTTISTNPNGSVATVDPAKTIQYGIGTGVGNALEKIADWYLKRADELYPIIEVPAGIVVDVVFTEDVKMTANLMEENG